MARKRMSERKMQGKILETKAVLDRIENAVEEINMTNKEKQTVRYTRRGLVSFEGKQYYFSANRFTMPIVYGATTVEAAFELAIALDNKMIQSKSNQKYFKTNAKDKYNQPNVYLDEISKGILIIKSGDKYMGYMPGAAGCRAVCYRKGGKPYSCSVKSLIKSLDKPGNQPFRTMEGQGQLIREKMIPELMRIVKILDERTNKALDPDKTGSEIKTEDINKMSIKEQQEIKTEEQNINKEEDDKVIQQNTKDNNTEEPKATYKKRRRVKSVLNNNDSAANTTNNKDDEPKIASETVVQKSYRRRRRTTNNNGDNVQC